MRSYCRSSFMYDLLAKYCAYGTVEGSGNIVFIIMSYYMNSQLVMHSLFDGYLNFFHFGLLRHFCICIFVGHTHLHLLECNRKVIRLVYV